MLKTFQKCLGCTAHMQWYIYVLYTRICFSNIPPSEGSDPLAFISPPPISEVYAIAPLSPSAHQLMHVLCQLSCNASSIPIPPNDTDVCSVINLKCVTSIGIPTRLESQIVVSDAPTSTCTFLVLLTEQLHFYSPETYAILENLNNQVCDVEIF